MSKRFLTVGSLLREGELLKYKDEIKNRDDISYPFYDDLEGYKEAEDRSVADVVKAQKDHNLVQISDGEHSKSLWHLDFVWGLNGAERYIADTGYLFRDKGNEGIYETRKDIGIKFVDKINGKNHPFIDHFKRLKDESGDAEIKQCIPSPSHIYGELLLFIGLDDGYYAGKEEEFEKDLIAAYKDFLKEFKEAGGEIVQFDDCLWELFSDDNQDFSFTSTKKKQEQPEELAEKFIDINNQVIDYGHELGLTVYTHNCRGNYESRSMSDGSYESIAHLFLEKQNYDRFYLEWDDERAGSIEALQAFKDRDVEVVLGLLSSKTNTLDDEKRVLDLLEKASEIIDKDRLYLSHQCGFASCDEGNELTVDEQWAKIDQGQKIAAEFWGE